MRENRTGDGAVGFVCRKVRDKTRKVRGDVGVWVGTSHAPAINVFCVNRPNQPDLSLGWISEIPLADGLKLCVLNRLFCCRRIGSEDKNELWRTEHFFFWGVMLCRFPKPCFQLRPANECWGHVCFWSRKQSARDSAAEPV